jgi:cation:H+ antiporter
MSDPLLILIFVSSAAVSLASSWALVSRLERIGGRLGVSEALLGLMAALAADAPEITASITALVGHQARIGAGVVIGSNVFNLAALLGLGAVVAGRIALHRRVILLEGAVAVPIAVATVVVATGAVPAAGGLAIVLVVLVPYIAFLALRGRLLRRLRLPRNWIGWLTEALVEEETELEAAMHPRPGRSRDLEVALVAVLIVVGASVAMEKAASTLGARHGVPEIVVGALVLAAVTSLPNAVAAIYLARRERGAATLSTAMNSNALNVAVGLMIPGIVLGLGASSGETSLVAAWYLGLTVFALLAAYAAHGLRRWHGGLIIAGYIVFAVALVATA